MCGRMEGRMEGRKRGGFLGSYLLLGWRMYAVRGVNANVAMLVLLVCVFDFRSSALEILPPPFPIYL